MTYLYLYIPGMAHEVQLSESADRIPNMGDRLEIVTVTGRRWSYGDGHTYCTLDVEVRN